MATVATVFLLRSFTHGFVQHGGLEDDWLVSKGGHFPRNHDYGRKGNMELKDPGMELKDPGLKYDFLLFNWVNF